MYFRFVWPTDLESIPHASTLIRFEVDMTIHCRVIALLYADPSRDIVTLIFDLFHVEQMSYTASHVTNLATKYEDPMLDPDLQLRWLYDESN